MNQDQVKGEWEQFSGKARKIWGKLSDDDVSQAKGSMEHLMGTIQSKFGDAKEEIKRKIAELVG